MLHGNWAASDRNAFLDISALNCVRKSLNHSVILPALLDHFKCIIVRLSSHTHDIHTQADTLTLPKTHTHTSYSPPVYTVRANSLRGTTVASLLELLEEEGIEARASTILPHDFIEITSGLQTLLAKVRAHLSMKLYCVRVYMNACLSGQCMLCILL